MAQIKLGRVIDSLSSAFEDVDREIKSGNAEWETYGVLAKLGSALVSAKSEQRLSFQEGRIFDERYPDKK